MAIDLEQFKKNVDASLKRNQEAFEGKYGEELNALHGLSADELAQACPNMDSNEEYARLIAVVQEASRMNISQASLRSQIKSLGDNAVQIAKMVGGLAALFA
jgi:hypothetical protein